MRNGMTTGGFSGMFDYVIVTFVDIRSWSWNSRLEGWFAIKQWQVALPMGFNGGNQEALCIASPLILVAPDLYRSPWSCSENCRIRFKGWVTFHYLVYRMKENIPRKLSSDSAAPRSPDNAERDATEQDDIPMELSRVTVDKISVPL